MDLFNIDAIAPKMWERDPRGFAYYLAGHLNTLLPYSVPGQCLMYGADASFDKPSEHDSDWRYLCARPAWPLSDFSIDSLHSVQEAFNTALGRWFVRFVRESGRAFEFPQDAFAQDVHALVGPSDMDAEMHCGDKVASKLFDAHEFRWIHCMDSELPEAKVFGDSDVLVLHMTGSEVGCFGIEPIRIGVPPGTEGLPWEPTVIEKDDVRYMEIPLVMRFRFSLFSPEYISYAVMKD